NVSVEPFITGAIDDSHSTAAQQRFDRVRRNPGSRRQFRGKESDREFSGGEAIKSSAFPSCSRRDSTSRRNSVSPAQVWLRKVSRFAGNWLSACCRISSICFQRSGFTVWISQKLATISRITRNDFHLCNS